MNYRTDKYGNELSILGFGCMRFPTKAGHIDLAETEREILTAIRGISLDELPQLFNILNGTMSIIGPRPMLDYQVGRCQGEEVRRFEVKPGMTGLAQAMGRNNLSWPERIVYDVKYVKEFTFLLDIKILFMTVIAVLKKTGTDVKPEYRGVDRFSKHYVPQEETKQ